MFDIDKLAGALQQRQFSEANRAFGELLQVMTANGHLPLSSYVMSSQHAELTDLALINHIAQLVCDMFTHPKSEISVPNYDALMTWTASLSQLFYLSEMQNADAAIEAIFRNNGGYISGENNIKLCVLFLTETKLAAQIGATLQNNPELLLNVCLALVWACSGSEQACANREWAYQQIPYLFEQLENPSYPVLHVHGSFMHSSYGFAANKHALKLYLNKIIKREIANKSLVPSLKTENKFSERAKNLMQENKTSQGAIKPVILIGLEFFNPQHSVYRVLGKSLFELKAKYTLVGVAWPEYVQIDYCFFDELIILSGCGVHYSAQELLDIAAAYKPAAMYYPSLGMCPWTIHHSNMRLAPVQFAAIGHGASSFATEIDYFLIESDIAGDQSTYSEKVIALKPGAMPFYPPTSVNYPKRVGFELDIPVLNIACSASGMKLNNKLLQICQNAVKRYQNSAIKVAFHFFIVTNGNGLSTQSYRKLIQSYLPQAQIHLSQSFQNYVDALSQMHISISPFPFSGMNTVIDYAMSGLPGIRMQGPQVHEMFDAGMWRRMAMPEWMIANDEAEYEAALYRLIDTPGLWQTLGQQLQHEERWKVFFDGDASQFVDAVDTMIANHTAQLT